VVNLFDLTKGNYSVLRTISYPDFPGSQIVTNAQVEAASISEWVTNITINGTYNGPTDVGSVKDYQLIWTADGYNILESGSATLELKSGGSVRQVWRSTITPERDFDNFPPAGELITISISPFQIDGNKMSYQWEGTVEKRVLEPVNDHFPPLGPGDTTTFFDPDGVCDGVTGLAGTFAIGATFMHNGEDTDTLSGLFFDVASLTGEGNVLCNADGGPGGVGSTLTVPIPLISNYSDGLLEPGGSFDVEFVIGLAVRVPFEFFVNLFGAVD